MMSSDDDDDEAQIRDEDHRRSTQMASASHKQQEASNRMRETGKKSRSAAPGRLKRVVSCKRKTHHHHRKPVSVSREAQMRMRSEDESRPTESVSDWSCCSQISEDHNPLMDVLHGRRLRLSLALTLWRRSTGELLAFLERLQDTSVLVDCLPALSRSLQEESAQVTLGFCVDLFPLVKTLLDSCFEDYLILALIWIRAALDRWSSLLLRDGRSSDYRNADALKQQLQDLWTLKTRLTSASHTTAHIWRAIESHLIQF